MAAGRFQGGYSLAIMHPPFRLSQAGRLPGIFTQKAVVQLLLRPLPGLDRVLKPAVAAQVIPPALKADCRAPPPLGRPHQSTPGSFAAALPLISPLRHAAMIES